MRNAHFFFFLHYQLRVFFFYLLESSEWSFKSRLGELRIARTSCFGVCIHIFLCLCDFVFIDFDLCLFQHDYQSLHVLCLCALFYFACPWAVMVGSGHGTACLLSWLCTFVFETWRLLAAGLWDQTLGGGSIAAAYPEFSDCEPNMRWQAAGATYFVHL